MSFGGPISALATLEGHFELTGALPDHPRAMFGVLMPLPTQLDGVDRTIRVELSSMPGSADRYGFVQEGLQPGAYHLLFPELGWSQRLELMPGEVKRVAGSYPGQAEVHLFLYDVERGVSIGSANVYLDRRQLHASSFAEGPEGAVVFRLPAGERCLSVGVPGYELGVLTSVLSPGMNALQLALQPYPVVSVRFSEPLEPCLEEWALGPVALDAEGRSAEIRVAASYVGSEVMVVFIEFPGNGRFELAWPRAGSVVAPLNIEVDLPRDWQREFLATIQSLENP